MDKKSQINGESKRINFCFSSSNQLHYSECLARVNEFRRIHDVDQVKINSKLSAEAQKWAETLALKDGLEHSDPESRINGKGENLSGFTGKRVLILFHRY